MSLSTRKGRPAGVRRTAVACCVAATLFLPAQAQEVEPPADMTQQPQAQPGDPETASGIGAGDVLEIRVGAWNLVETRFEEWTGVSGEAVVQSDGTILVPMAGIVEAAARPLSDISEDIVRELAQITGLPTQPSVTVRILSRAPVFVSGDVMAPGAYAFTEGLTVRQAVTLAGGELRLPVEQITTALGRLAQLEEGIQRTALSIARLEAELDGAEPLVVPPSLADTPETAVLVAGERRLLATQRDAIASQSESIDALIGVLRGVKDGLLQQLAVLDEDLGRAEAEVERRETMLERGLIRATDMDDAQSRLSSLQLRKVDMSTQLLTVEKDLSEAQRDRDQLRQSRDIRILEELSSLRDRKRDLELGLIGLKADLAATGGMPRADSAEFVASIIPAEGGAARRVGLETRIRPGDTVLLEAIEG
ncbi:polysaccharide biosynthesis/export family protein [Palleronia rufa]|uniref:polysaccharide biosynthesis/export family protein n=1 Tax=Palleronia rufa TaxID=1530186 RepID=UPI00055F5D6B|nr:polysaccharide biosynthesis/export family protein [Palleronia rufa]